MTKELRLADSKTGPRRVPLSPPAVEVLAALPRVSGNPWVIPGHKPATHLTNLDTPWHTIRKRAGLEDVRIHDLRHSFVLRALALGESLPMIGKLLGHSQIQTTARYARLECEAVRLSAARVAASIGALCLSPISGTVSAAACGADGPEPKKRQFSVAAAFSGPAPDPGVRARCPERRWSEEASGSRRTGS